MTRLTVTGTWSAVVWPVTRSTRVSAMTWLRARGSPWDLAWSAALVRVAQIATPWVAGSRADSWAMVSGAGRRVTRRSASAFDRRLTTAWGSIGTAAHGDHERRGDVWPTTKEPQAVAGFPGFRD